CSSDVGSNTNYIF
nr:immunoglobulin light chain junction region [Macaca mulatta]MPN79702.1 immunoglobulin light chain junction region [Macaca mulatta]MPN79706.1 immunoglobulin light chain junction region [Macaca mulatta]MPN79707.1 immunoglobulin light chain junction region [Macaca mulatta]MPN79716.1 immunoglobulin light chain junction region [Macaca mulatta]